MTNLELQVKLRRRFKRKPLNSDAWAKELYIRLENAKPGYMYVVLGEIKGEVLARYCVKKTIGAIENSVRWCNDLAHLWMQGNLNAVRFIIEQDYHPHGRALDIAKTYGDYTKELEEVSKND